MPKGIAPVAIAAGAVALSVAAFAVQPAIGAPLVSNFLIVDVCLGIVSTILGAFIVRRLPGNPMGWLFLLSGTAYALTAGVVTGLSAGQAWGWPGTAGAAWLSEWVFLLALGPQVTLLLLLFPDGRPPGPRWRPVAVVSSVGIGVLVVLMMLAPEVGLDETRRIPNPLVAWEPAEVLIGPSLIVLGLSALASVASLVLRLVRAEGQERRRIAPFVAAAFLVVVGLLGARWVPSWEPVIQTATLPLLPLSAAACIVRYRLFDLEVVVRRSLVWLGLSGLIVAGYAAVVAATANLLKREAGLAETLFAVGVVAAAFHPARLWFDSLVGRVLYGHRDLPGVAALRLGESMAADAGPGATLAAVAQRVAESLASPWVAVEVNGASDGEGTLTAEAGKRPGWADDSMIQREPLVHLGEVEGTLTVCRRSPKEPLSSKDQELIRTLGYPLAATAAALRLTEDLRGSRERLVRAREEERRRLRRDLHDDLGPLLAALLIQIDAAQVNGERRDALRPGLLAELRETADEAVSTLRRAVEHLRPPALDELGLVPTIEEQAKRMQVDDGPVIEVHAPERMPALSAASEVAAHRIAIEAVTNAVRHAEAKRIECRLELLGGHTLVVEVTDDGAGLRPGWRSGVGMSSMQERAEELGGRCELSSDPEGGTTVRATIPVGAG